MSVPEGPEAAVCAAYLDALSAAFAGMLDRLDDALFDLAERSETEELRASYFEVMRGIRQTREEFQSRFLDLIRDVWAGAQPPAAASAEQAENMAFSLAVRYAESECADELALLRRRLLSHVAHPAGVQRALAPRVLFGAFEHVCEGLQAAMPVRLVLLKFFERHVGAELRAIYGRLIALMDGTKAQPAHALVEAQPLAVPETAAAGGTDLGSVLNRLVHGERTGAVEVLKLLATQQSDGSGMLRHTASLDLARIGGEDASATVTAVDLAVDMMALLYDGSYADPTISPFVKVQLARLQLPLLKVAMRDGGFLSRRSHPARRFFSALLALGRARGHTLQSAEEARLSELVDRVAERCVEDPAIFETGLAVLGILAPPAAGQAGVGRDLAQLERAEANARRALDRLCAGRTLPEAVERFLGGHWLRHLVDVHLRSGADGPAWRRALGTADALVWAVTAADTSENRVRLADLRTRLVRQLRSGLDELAVPAPQQEAFYGELRELLDAALYVEPPAQEVAVADLATDGDVPAVLTLTNSAGEAIALAIEPAEPGTGESATEEQDRPSFEGYPPAGPRADASAPPSNAVEDLLRRRGLDTDTTVIEEIVLEGSAGRDFGAAEPQSPPSGSKFRR
jgi:hypothetical protein